MSRKIVYHIHSDLKFAQKPTGLFPDSKFENRYVFLEQPGEVCRTQIEGFRFSHGEGSAAVASHLSDADIVVFYSLNCQLATIANRLPERMVLIWRFFGYELYDKMPEFIYTKATRRLLANISRIACMKRWLKGQWSIRGGIKRILRLFAQREHEDRQTPKHEHEYKRAIGRMDFFCCLAHAEYDFLARRFPLPPLLQLPYTVPLSPGYEREKEPMVILGHSRIMYGNHLDMLKILGKLPSAVLQRYRFKAFFSYGPENAYTREVRRLASRFPTLQLIEGFMPIEEFTRCYDKAAALVIYAFRQVAMGNIYTALRAGAKVYLPSGNVLFKWLQKEGFILSDVTQFRLDLRNGTIHLSVGEMEQNRKAWVRLTEKYNVAAYTAKVLEACEKKAQSDR